MNWDVLLSATVPIPHHAIAAFAAVALGGMQFALPKGTLVHRMVGYAWIALMLFVAISGFFIHSLRIWGPFSPIHLLSILTIFTLGTALYYARAGKIKSHKRAMVMLFAQALIVTGAFTFLPGRIMFEVVAG